MLSRHLRIVITVACLSTSTSLLQSAKCEQDAPVIDYEMPGSEISLAVEGNIKRICEDVLGYGYPAGTIAYSRNNNIYAWKIATKGKHGLITSCIVIEDGIVLDCRILSSREIRGKPIKKKRYLSQFKGISLVKSKKLSKRVDAISGATISSQAVVVAVKLALRLDAVCKALRSRE